MKKMIALLSFAWSFAFLPAQTTSTFENLALPLDSFLNGSDGSGGFASGYVYLPNFYDTQFLFWSGWAISSETDAQTPGFLNQYSSVAGGGHNGSKNYALTYCFDGSVMRIEGAATGQPVEGLWVTNSAYAYYSMRDGDAFSKKFGGITGADPDYFLLTIRKFYNGVLSADSVNFYLADYRSANNAQDYIVDEWTFVDLSVLGDADSLWFTLTSTDIGQFGMNTPAYFCVDDVITAGDPLSAAEAPALKTLEVFPNPAADFIYLTWPHPSHSDLFVTDIYGRRALQTRVNPGANRLDLSALPAGMYFLQGNAPERGVVVKN